MCYTFTFLPLNPDLYQTSIVVHLPIPTFIDDVLGLLADIGHTCDVYALTGSLLGERFNGLCYSSLVK
jgi:hypothetical protein